MKIFNFFAAFGQYIFIIVKIETEICSKILDQNLKKIFIIFNCVNININI